MKLTNTKSFQISITCFLHCDLSTMGDKHMACGNPIWLFHQNKIPTESWYSSATYSEQIFLSTIRWIHNSDAKHASLVIISNTTRCSCRQMVTAVNLIEDLFKLLGESTLPNLSHRRESEETNRNKGGWNPKHWHPEGILGHLYLLYLLLSTH